MRVWAEQEAGDRKGRPYGQTGTACVSPRREACPHASEKRAAEGVGPYKETGRGRIVCRGRALCRIENTVKRDCEVVPIPRLNYR